jgi:hypothetical protein
MTLKTWLSRPRSDRTEPPITACESPSVRGAEGGFFFTANLAERSLTRAKVMGFAKAEPIGLIFPSGKQMLTAVLNSLQKSFERRIRLAWRFLLHPVTDAWQDH